MLNLIKVVRQLKNERKQAQMKLEQLDAALKVLSGLGSTNRGARRGRAVAKERRTMSAAARKRIAVAQRARWAKWRAAKPRK